MEKQKGFKKFFTLLFKPELENQVKNYANLSIFCSIRKIAASLILLSVIISLVAVMTGYVVPSNSNWVVIVISTILFFFIYKGKKWAMIVAMIAWTFFKSLSIINCCPMGDFNVLDIRIISIIGWMIFMWVFWQAYRIERKREKDL